MDRSMVFTGALPQTVDILNTNKQTMFGLGYGMQMVLGTSTYIDGLACLPTSPTADLHVNVQVGSIYSLTEVDASAYSDLGTDTTSIVKQGINPTVQVLTITPPGTSGQSQVYLVEAIYSDVDGGSQVLSYFNASNPSAPYSGPANAGTSNFTVRKGVCTIALKAGVAAPTGTQTTPAPDAGYTGLFAVTVANGQTQITSTNIVQLTTAPIVGAANKLPAIPASVQSGMWMYGVDTSIGGNVVTTAQTLSSSAVLTFASVPSWMAAGLKVYDQTTTGAITGGQTVLSSTSTTVTLSANVNATVNSGDTIVFSNDLFASTLSPIPASLTPGMAVRVKLNSGNVGAATFNPNGLGAAAIHRAGGAALSSGDLVANMIAELVYDGSFWQIQNFLGQSGSSVTNNNTYTSSNLPYALDTSTSSNTITVSPTPALPATISAGQVLIVKLANPITGATTVGITGVTGSPFPVISFTGQPLTYGSGSTGEMLWMLFDGANFQIINPPQPLQANLTIYVDPSVGSDSYDGSQPTVSGTKGPLLHIQTAVNKAFNYPSSLFIITIQCANGTYNEAIATPQFPGPQLIINGNSGSPSSVLVTGAANRHTFSCSGPNVMTVKNLKVTASNTGAQNCAFISSNGATFYTKNTISGAVNLSVFEAYGPSFMVPGTHTFSGNCTYAFAAINGGFIPLDGPDDGSFTIGASITVSNFVYCAANGNISMQSGFQPSFINPGNVTGTKYVAALNGVINTAGEGVNYFPGNVAGVVQTGGQYA